MSKHVFQLDEDGEIDIFAHNEYFHNGPKCVVCGKCVCHHCNPEIYTEECSGVSKIEKSVKESCEWCTPSDQEGYEGVRPLDFISFCEWDGWEDVQSKMPRNFCPSCGRRLEDIE